MRRVIDIALCAARTDADGAGGGIDPHAFHHRHVDHQSVVDTTKARSVMPASADRDLEIVLPCKIHRGDNVSSVGASRNHLGLLVDHPVVETPGGVILGIPSPDDGTTHVADEGFGGRGLHDVLLFPQMIGQLVRPHSPHCRTSRTSSGLGTDRPPPEVAREVLDVPGIRRRKFRTLSCQTIYARWHLRISTRRAGYSRGVKGVDGCPHDRTSSSGHAP